jgi:Na+/H+-dicarboxylate symporter
MTIIPLVFSLLVTGINSAAGKAAGSRLATRTLLIFAVLLLAAALFAAVVLTGLLAIFPIPEEAARQVRASLGEAGPVPVLPAFGDWLRSFIPTNPVGAAAEGRMVPVVVFALIFGLAAARIPDRLGESLMGVMEAVVQSMLVIVQWVLLAAPIGIFALALVVGLQAGVSAAGALAHYLIVMALLLGAVTLAAYPLAVLAGKVPLLRFVRAAAPAQLVAFSTQSSVASLPAMIDAAQIRLGLPEHVVGLVLPMAVSIFRITSASANMAVAVYIAALFGVHVGPLTMAVGVVVAAIVSLAAVGLPSQVSFFSAVGPICLAIGAPLQALPLLLAVESIPDMLRTVGNVTADIAVTAIARRFAEKE